MNYFTSLHASGHPSHGGFANEAMFLMSFVIVLCVALAAQLVFFKWRKWFPGSESEKSLLKGVRAGVYTFLSHIN